MYLIIINLLFVFFGGGGGIFNKVKLNLFVQIQLNKFDKCNVN